MPLDVAAVRGILPRGGTILGSSRTNPVKVDGGVERDRGEPRRRSASTRSIAIGGEDTLGRRHHARTSTASTCVGVPKTIDNDLNATDYTFGFDTAVNIATEAIDRLHTTAESHHRALVVEVMGRHAGWIALHAGHGRRRQRHPHPGAAVRHRPGLRLRRAAGSSRTTRRSSSSPRVRCPTDGDLMTKRRRRSTRSATSASAASASGWPSEIEERTGKEARTTVLGHVQRGGTPTAFDRVARHPVRAARDRRGARRRLRA